MKLKLLIFVMIMFICSVVMANPIAMKKEEFAFLARYQIEKIPYNNKFEVVEKTIHWNPKETAVIVIDMWDRHWCNGATNRVVELAPAINQFITIARNKGMLIVHAPSNTMNFYKYHYARHRAKNAPTASNLPIGIDHWCHYKSIREMMAKFPIVDSDGGCETGNSSADVWTRQIDTIEIKTEDAISDSGKEIWNLLNQYHIKNVIIVGVAANMCVVGRPFGLRNLSRFGINTMLVRDLTDAMYNPKMPPYVNHFSGLRLVVDYIEKFISPSMTSTALTGKPEFRFAEDNTPYSP